MLNAKAPGMVKALVRDARGTAQCLVFWSSIRKEAVVAGNTYVLSVHSTACIKLIGLPKKSAAPDARYFASYGAFNMNFGSVSDFWWTAADATESLGLISASDAAMLPTAALATPIGITASLLDITGTVMSCYGRRDTTTAQRPYLELVLVSGAHHIRVRIRSVWYV